MKKKRLFLLLILSALFLLLPAGTALAAPVFDTIVTDGDVIDNDVVLFDDDLDVQTGGVINGDVTIFNGDATINGTVNGEVVIFDGDLFVGEGGDLNGDCVLFGGAVDSDSARSVSCTQFDNFIPSSIAGLIDEGVAAGDIPSAIEVERPSSGSQFFTGVAEAVGQTLVMGVFAFILAAAAPQRVQRVTTAVRQKPVDSGAVGTLTALASPFVIAILALLSAVLILACGLGLLGFPVIIGLVLGLVAASVMGWVALGSVAGEKMAQWLNLQNRSLTVTTVLGTMSLTMLLGLLGAIPFFIGEGLVTMLLLWLGLGAVALTKFGTRSYPVLAMGGGPIVDEVKLQPDPDKVTAVLDTLPDDKTN